MKPAKRYPLLFGPYKTPKFKYGKVVFCECRGQVTLCGLTDARIPWPIGKRVRQNTIVLYADLAKAVRRESAAN